MTVQAQNAIDKLLISPQAMTNSATVTANLDTLEPGQGRAGYATLRIGLGTEKNANALGPTISVLQSDDTVVSNFATFDSNLEVTGADGDLSAAKELRYEIDLRHRKRYIRLSVTTATATNDDVTVCAFATLTRLGGTVGSPASTTEMGDDTVVIS